MKTFDVGIGWSNPIDTSFTNALTFHLKKQGLSFKEITYKNLDHDFDEIYNERLHFNTFVDRSSLDNPAYFLLAEKLRSHGARVINDPFQVVRFGSKTTLHKLFESERLPIPKTFILDPEEYSPRYFEKIVNSLGVPFVLKPSYGGEIDDISLTGRNIDDIIHFLESRGRTEECLVQSYIPVSVIQGRAAWFRPIFVCNHSIPLWWDPKNHFYQEFESSKEEKKISAILEKFLQTIFRITGLELFSTEVAIDHTGAFVIVDYANHPIDLNSQEMVPDGLPSQTINIIAQHVVNSIHDGKKNYQ